MRAISLAEANKIIDGTFASAEKRQAYALAAIVLDAGGRVKAFQKQDGASLMPSPINPTTCFFCRKARMIRCLCAGETRANTWTRSALAWSCSSLMVST